jgi:O-antigen/teichoic acid export membrane protein
LGRELHRSVVVNWLGLGIRIGVALFLLPFIINRLGVDRYGEYFFLASIFGYSELLDLGLRASILRYVGNLSASAEYDRLNRILGSVFRYYSLAAAGVLSLGILVYLLLPEEWFPVGASARFALYAAMFSTVAASSFFRVGWSSVVQARERYDLLNLIETGAFLVRAAVIVVFLSRGHGLVVLIGADILNNLGSALCSRYVAARIAPQIRPDRGRIAVGELREVVSYSGWAFLNSMAFQLRFRGPGLIVGSVLTTTSTGYYGVAARIQSYVLQLGTAMNAPFRARATTIAGLDDQASMQDILFRGTRMLTFVGFALGSILYIHAERLLVTWMNPEFGAVASVLRVLLIGLAAEISVLMLGGGLFATGRLRFYAISNTCEAGGIVLLATLLARRFGLDGAAYGIMIPLVLNKGLLQPAFLLRFLGSLRSFRRRRISMELLCRCFSLGSYFSRQVGSLFFGLRNEIERWR